VSSVADDSPAAVVAKLGLGIGVGFALYHLIRNLRFGGGFGFGGERERGDGTTGPAPSPSPPAPSTPVPSIPRDDQPLLFVAIHPDGFKGASKLPDPTSRARLDVVFRRIDLGTAELSPDEVYSRMTDVLRRERDKGTPPLVLDDVIARVKAGGRDDARLISPGSVRQGTWDDAKDALMAAGIKHWLLKQEFPADRKPGDPPKRSRWDLYDKVAAVGNPDKAGHYLVENRGTAYWNLKDSAPHVSGTAGNMRGQYGRGYGR
jgi:hypothetical protein